MTQKLVDAEMNQVTIMDTTLRDGEQTSGVSFSDNEKLAVAKVLLEDLRVERIEIASARVSVGEFKGAQRVLRWAAGKGHLDRVEILGFVDDRVSLQWIADAGGKVINLLCKGSLKHVSSQLRKTPEQHLADIKKVIANAGEMGIKVNVYLEDWSNGMRNSKDYVHFLVENLSRENIERIMLPDTLGILDPDETYNFCRKWWKPIPAQHSTFMPTTIMTWQLPMSIMPSKPECAACTQP